MSVYKGPRSGSFRDIKVEVSVTVTDRSELYALVFNRVFYKEDQAERLSFSMKSSVLFPLGFYSSSVPLLHPQGIAVSVLVSRVFHTAHNLPYLRKKYTLT